jgi:hypothetical protein
MICYLLHISLFLASLLTWVVCRCLHIEKHYHKNKDIVRFLCIHAQRKQAYPCFVHPFILVGHLDHLDHLIHLNKRPTQAKPGKLKQGTNAPHHQAPQKSL